MSHSGATICRLPASRGQSGTLVETRPEECFVAGLMHGIGQLLLRSIEPELYRTIDAVVATGEPRRQAEQAVLGLDHATRRRAGA